MGHTINGKTSTVATVKSGIPIPFQGTAENHQVGYIYTNAEVSYDWTLESEQNNLQIGSIVIAPNTSYGAQGYLITGVRELPNGIKTVNAVKIFTQRAIT